MEKGKGVCIDKVILLYWRLRNEGEYVELKLGYFYFEKDKHTWVELKKNNKTYILDPALGYGLRTREEWGKDYYIEEKQWDYYKNNFLKELFDIY